MKNVLIVHMTGTSLRALQVPSQHKFFSSKYKLYQLPGQRCNDRKSDRTGFTYQENPAIDRLLLQVLLLQVITFS